MDYKVSRQQKKNKFILLFNVNWCDREIIDLLRGSILGKKQIFYEIGLNKWKIFLKETYQMKYIQMEKKTYSSDQMKITFPKLCGVSSKWWIDDSLKTLESNKDCI